MKLRPQDIIAHALIGKAQECLDPTNGDLGSARVLLEAASCVMVDPAGLTSTDRLQRIYDRGDELTQQTYQGE